MIQIDGRYYFINFEQIDKIINGGVGATDERFTPEAETTEEVVEGEINKKITTTKIFRPKEVNAIRYQIISAMIDDLLNGGGANEGENDGYSKKSLDSLPLGSKLSFNTLLEYGIISFIDIE